MRLPRRLNTRVVLMVSCVLLVTGVASGWIAARDGASRLLGAMRNSSSVIARNLAAGVAREMLTEDYAGLEAFLLKSAHLPDVRRLLVIEANGALVWDVEHGADGDPVARTGVARLPLPANSAAHTEIEGETLAVWEPVEAGTRLGWLKAEFSLADIRAAQVRAWKDALLLAMMWVAASAVLILLILSPIVRSIGALSDFSKRLSDHKGEQISLPGQPAEIMELAVSLNHASTRLQATERELIEERERLRKLNMELERRVAERTAQLETANKELEAFSYSVSHDLRAPLRHIDGFIHILREDIEANLNEEDRHYMDVIAKAARQMEALIEDLLAFSRIGRSELCLAPVDLGALVAEVIQDAEPDARGRRIEWRIGELPSVNGDRALLRVVMSNLIQNALKFTRQRDPGVIEISAETLAEETHVVVRDNGAGFDMAYVGKLFGVFQRLHRADDFEGTGIGLANVRRVVSRHGGRVWAEGKVGEGAAFHFSLPNAPR